MSVDLSGKKILIVDDEADLREILREELQARGAIVAEAPNGRVAFDICSKDKQDLVITDIRMPGGDGVELLKRLNDEMGSEAPGVFFVTGFSDLNPPKATALGAKGMLMKPFSLLQLSQTLSKYLNKK